MKINKIKLIGTLFLALISVLATSTAYAKSGYTVPDNGGPNGLAVYGDASGVKLSGVISITFSNIHCEFPGSFTCGSEGPKLSTAVATLRLKDGSSYYQGYGNSKDIKVMTATLENVSYYDVPTIQNAVMKAFEPQILLDFFQVPISDPPSTNLKVHLKSISEYGITYVTSSDAAPNTYFQEPGVDGNIIGYTVIADLVVAVNDNVPKK